VNNRRNYNSIVFLTVYLGLVLVSGSPQILAQAATPRLFDIKTEIEFKDDLDKKPDDEKAFDVYSSVLEDLYPVVREVAAQNADFLRGANYEFNCAHYILPKVNGKFQCKGGIGIFSGKYTDLFRKINQAFPHVSGEEKEQIRVNLILSKDDFFVRIALNQSSDKQAAEARNFYDAVFPKVKLQTVDVIKTFIYQNTFFSSENNQVFIVTRLPRASIDELLAVKNAQ
jgi:hypothetical protein